MAASTTGSSDERIAAAFSYQIQKSSTAVLSDPLLTHTKRQNSLTCTAQRLRKYPVARPAFGPSHPLSCKMQHPASSTASHPLSSSPPLLHPALDPAGCPPCVYSPLHTRKKIVKDQTLFRWANMSVTPKKARRQSSVADKHPYVRSTSPPATFCFTPRTD